jgi:hypothetical protein
MFDDELWPLAQSEARMLITTDKGFSEHRDEPHHGVLIVRLRQPNQQRIHARVMAAFHSSVLGEGLAKITRSDARRRAKCPSSTVIDIQLTSLTMRCR